MNLELKKCVWMWAGLLTYRLCDRDYQCDGCPVEALFRPTDTAALHAGARKAEGIKAARDLPTAASRDRFHDEQHLWLRILPAGRLQVGFDPLASRLLSSAQRIDLPTVGSRLRQGQTLAVVHLPGGPIRFGSPVNGTIRRAHAASAQRLRRMLARPYTRAWLVILDAPRVEHQLHSLVFGRTAGLRMAHEWNEIQEECLALAAGVPAGHPALPDGGELDLDRLADWAGPAYQALIRSWIGDARRGSGQGMDSASLRGRGNRGGTGVPPEER